LGAAQPVRVDGHRRRQHARPDRGVRVGLRRHPRARRRRPDRGDHRAAGRTRPGEDPVRAPGLPQRSDPMSGFPQVLELLEVMRGDAKHAEAAGSTADALWVLYDRVLRVSPALRDDRDRFYLSKGHGPMAYYAVLAAKGFLDPAELYGFGDFHSPLGHHPDRHK